MAIRYYGTSLIGNSHIRKGGCCQDAHLVTQLNNGWTIAAIADGVGSAAHAEEGAQIACSFVVSFCEIAFPLDEEIISLKSMMRTAYNYAYKAVWEHAMSQGNPIEDYDTTLSIVLWNGEKLVYGHSGDGGILGLTESGQYIQITTPLKGEDGVSVLPLRAGYRSWSIGSRDERFVSLLLMTDGMLDIFTPYLLKETTDGIYHTMAAMFMRMPENEEELSEEDGQRAFAQLVSGELTWDDCEENLRARLAGSMEEEALETYIASVREEQYPLKLLQGVSDDRTVVCVFDDEQKIIESMAENEPDWKDLNESWRRKAYPHLYQKEEQDE